MTDRTATDDPAAAQASIAAASDIPALPAVLSAREAATALGISERTVRRAIQRGELTATKHAGTFQITPAAIAAYQQRETGQRTLSRAATLDAAAAAQVARPTHAAVADSGQSAAAAVAVLRELLTEERQRADHYYEASLLWQNRAFQLEQRLHALEAGPIAGEASPDALVGPVEAPPRDERPAAASETPVGRWWRRVRDRF